MIYPAILFACLWSAGCFGIPPCVAWSMWRDDEKGIAIAVILVIWPLMALLGTIPWIVFSEAKSPDLATLKKGEWACSQSHNITTTAYVMSGKMLVPITSSHQVCDQYNRSAP